MRVRERPPLRLAVDAVAPSGRHYRWGEDEAGPADTLSGLRFSSTMPGGYESLDAVLPRKSGVDYSDLERLSTLRVLGPPNDVRGEYRLERAPRTSGAEVAISPSAVGWQAHLEDDKSARAIIVDRDLPRWTDPSAQRQLNLIAASWSLRGQEVTSDPSTAVPALKTQIEGPSNGWANNPISEALYDAGPGLTIDSLYYAWTRGSTINNADANWLWAAYLSALDTFTSVDQSGNLRAAGPGSGTLSASANDRRFAALQLAYAASGGSAAETIYPLLWTTLAVYGAHGLTKRGAAPSGFWASDVIAYALKQWAPMLTFTTGPNGTIRDTNFIIPHLVFPDATTTAEMLSQANRFDLCDWAVWGGKTFYLHPRNAEGRKWRARVGPSELAETGPQVDRLWESVLVQFTDVDGTTKIVGPPGSGVDVEDSQLKDADIENPANKLGMTRRDLLVMETATFASAIQTGARFLTEQRALDASGQAKFTGWCEDEHGVVHPASRMRAGDQVAFTDAADPSYRRIVRADYAHSDRTAGVDLDSPPEGLQALLQRLGVKLVRLGLS